MVSDLTIFYTVMSVLRRRSYSPPGAQQVEGVVPD